MATELAITISDLHLGRGTEQDDFRGGMHFVSLCNDLVNHIAETGQRLTFVLNGDIIDLWEIVDDDQLADNGRAAILEGLCYPAVTDAEKQRATDHGIQQIDSCLDAHPEFLAGMAILLRSPTEVHYLAGNHDHAMVNPALQAHLLTRLAEVAETPATRFRFGLSLNRPEVGS